MSVPAVVYGATGYSGRLIVERMCALGVPAVVYGATGYSGRLIVERMCALGLAPRLCGRDTQRLAQLGEAMRLPWRAAAVTDGAGLDQAFAGAGVVLNAAGPFAHTADAVASACLRVGAHYLDISGEVRAVERLATRHAAARRRGLMLMPAVGFDVVPTDCLAARLARRLPGARRLVTAVTQPAFLSAGSMKSLVDSIDVGVMRRDGVIQPVALGSVERAFDFGWGPVACRNVSLADTATAYYTTGIPNVQTFVESSFMVRFLLEAARLSGPVLQAAGWLPFLSEWAERLPAEIAPGQVRPDLSMRAVVEAEDDSGCRVSARLRVPEVYAFTAMTSGEVARRVLAGDLEPGFQTPARVYGSDFVLSFPEVVVEDLADGHADL